jgi:hypothetical protein
MQVPVVSITRECQYVDENWIRCGRLAYVWHYQLRGGQKQMTFRCLTHDQGGKDNINESSTFGLGYKP